MDDVEKLIRIAEREAHLSHGGDNTYVLDMMCVGVPGVIVWGDTKSITAHAGTRLHIGGRWRTYDVKAVDFEDDWIVAVQRPWWRCVLDHLSDLFTTDTDE